MIRFGNGWTAVKNMTPEGAEALIKVALTEARGCYQRNLINGRENLSGSSLRGSAKNYADRYQRSAFRLLGRLRAVGIEVSEMKAENNRRILVLG
jgi:hypothetical protein